MDTILLPVLKLELPNQQNRIHDADMWFSGNPAGQSIYFCVCSFSCVELNHIHTELPT